MGGNVMQGNDEKRDQHSPEIRFRGFSGEWKIVKLGDYAKFRRGSFPQPYGNKEWYGGEGALPFVQVVDVTDKLSLVENTKQKISVIAQPKSIYVEKGKVLVTLQGSIGRVAIAQYDCYVDRTLLIFELFEQETDSYFWAYLIQNKFDTEKKKAPGGTIKTITKEALSAFPIKLSRYKEQTKIGEFFEQIDRLISQHQQKHDKLLNIKKALLEKMFPRSGKTEPEIRFKGFSGEWEHCELGKNAIIKGRLGWKSLKQDEYIKDGPSMIAGRHINNGQINWEEVDHIPEWRYFESPEIMLQDNDVIFSKDGSLGNPAIIKNLKGYATINSTMMLVRTKNKLVADFFYRILETENFYNLIKLKISGSSILHLFQADMNTFSFDIPNTTQEQTKIGNFFQQIDRLISQHQTQIQKLNHLKQAFLSKMFV